MITEIIGKDFKGLTFSQPVKKKTIFLGPNGIGKSARTQALILAVNGYIPGSSKLNEEIWKNYGCADIVSVGFVLNGMTFERAWQNTGTSTKEAFQINKKRCAKDFYLQALGEAGTPKIFDISSFLTLSDQKKIDYILGLYPSDTSLTQIETMIETQKKNILLLEDKARSAEKASAALTASRATMKLPSGSLAETTAAIETAEKELSEAQKELSDINAQNLAEQTKIKAEEKAAAEAETAKKKAEIAKTMAESAHKAELERVQKAAAKEVKAAKEEKVEASVAVSNALQNSGVVKILQSILGTMEESGCTVCAAKMVCKKELKKYAK
jgi:hypothetical protein